MSMNSKGFLGLALICGSLITYNTFSYWDKHTQEQRNHSVPLHSLTYKFTGLENLFQNIRYVGYYTDKNIDDVLTVAQYEQAQYVVAPTVLVLNKTNFPFVIFDCTTTEVALSRIKSLGLKPISANAGIVLAFNPSFTP
jgi:hypothetical protein